MDRRIAQLISEPFAGQRIDAEQIALIQQTAVTFAALSRRELAHTVCEHFSWQTPSGNNRVQFCLRLLERMEALGLLVLPEKSRRKARTSQRPIQWGVQSEPQPRIETPLKRLVPLQLELVTSAAAISAWNEIVDRHHYLGYRRPIGPHLRYFILDAQDRKLGCVMFTYAARAVVCRDAWIGWQHQTYKQQLQRVIQNNRFLLLPWVKVKNLASKSLSMTLRQVADDWSARHGYRPVLVETYVDLTRFKGSCYRAANWQYLGATQKRRDKTQKGVYVYPLVKDFRTILLSEEP